MFLLIASYNSQKQKKTLKYGIVKENINCLENILYIHTEEKLDVSRRILRTCT